MMYWQIREQMDSLFVNKAFANELTDRLQFEKIPEFRNYH